eukprot:TRINITY_DN4551_c0_g1_i2.p1 TRINITY_DN4551_c0_g1~~TRINITY_DN4551_c0_g1_i2.p1  ORF type:complete len:272 (+),score=62.74 TRINITY_DN4551_c0_g1_i2:210-1025(+)
MLGLEASCKTVQDKFTGTVSLGDGDALAMTKLLKEEGGDWHQFQQLKLPSKICGETITPVPKRKKKEDEVLVFDAKKELSLVDVLKNNAKVTASNKKRAVQGITQEEFSQLLIEKNYHFPLNRLTRLILRPMMLKLKMDRENMKKKTDEREMADIQGDLEDLSYAAEAPLKAQIEDNLELNLDLLAKAVNPKQLKAKLWKEIDNKTTEKSGTFYKTEFSSLFASIQANQQCSPQACFVCLLHLANEKGTTSASIRLADRPGARQHGRLQRF